MAAKGRDYSDLGRAVLERFAAPEKTSQQPIVTVDSHTAGEPTRLVVGGLPPIPGETVNDKRLYVSRELDFVRRLLMCEPRGHRDMFGAIITGPVSPEAAFGLIYMDTRRYPYLCGHATIGAVTTLIEAGAIEAREPETVVVVDSPSDLITTRARVEGGRVQWVEFQPESAFVYRTDRSLEVPGLGMITVDSVCCGGFCVMVSADEIDFSSSSRLALRPANAGTLARLGMNVIEAANEQLSVEYPGHEYVNTTDAVEFYGASGRAGVDGRSVMILGEGHVDRSPCATGTSAKMALLHRRGELALGDRYVNEGISGTTFEGRIVAERQVGDLPAVVPAVRGSAYITGVHRFLLDVEDPFPEGFLLGS